MQIKNQRRARPLVQQLRRRRSLRAGLAQLLYIAAGVGLGLLVPTLDAGARIPSAEVAALLAGVTAGLLALTGIVFALLFLVVQFAATAQSPRLHLFRDKPLVWHALGLAVGVMVYATTCVVVTADEPTTTVLVPISVIVLVVLAVAITRRLQLDALWSVDLATTLERVTARTRTVIDRLYSQPFTPSSEPPLAVPDDSVKIRWPGTQQFLRQIDLPELIELARQADATIRLPLKPGDLVRENAVVLEVWNPGTPPDPRPLLKCLELGIDRTIDQDPVYGFRLLNDIALRAMSPAINDPATAVQALDSIENLLTVLVGRDLAIGVIDDDANTRRVVFDAYDWEDFLSAGADEIGETGMHPIVARRLREMLEQVHANAPVERRSSVEHRLAAFAKADDQARDRN
jgi:uncharacterized membrane protein